MTRRMEPKDVNDLALDDKLDVARTMLSLNHRIQLRHEKNQVEAIVKQSHAQEVADGRVTEIALTNIGSLLTTIAPGHKALETGDESNPPYRDVSPNPQS